MARTKTKPPPRDSWGLPPRRLVADPGSPRTPGGQGVRYAAQQSAYPTPDTPTKSKSTSEDRAQQQQLVKDEDRTQYGRWSSSGRSWFVNRRSIPGDRPPPPGISYRYRRRLSFTKPRSPAPQRLLTPEKSSDDSEPIVRRPRRGVIALPSEKSDDETIDDGSGIQQEEAEVSSDDETMDEETNTRQEKADISSDDSEPVVRRPRRGVIVLPSEKSDAETIDDGSNIHQEEPDLSSDDSEPLIRRHRRKVVLAPSEPSNPSIQGDDPSLSSDDPDPILIRRRRRPPALHESPATSNAADDTDSDPRKASVVGNLYDRIKNRRRGAKPGIEQPRSRSPRVSGQHRRRSPVQGVVSRDAGAKEVRSAGRRGGVAEEAGMMREDEEEFLEGTPSEESEGSEYEDGDDGDGDGEDEIEE